MTYYMCFIQTLIIRCTVYEIQPIFCDLYLTFNGHLKSFLQDQDHPQEDVYNI